MAALRGKMGQKLSFLRGKKVDSAVVAAAAASSGFVQSLEPPEEEEEAGEDGA